MRWAATLIAAGMIAAASVPGPASGEAPRVRRGRLLAETYCGRCHAVGRIGESHLAIAPRFRDLHTRYPVEDLAEALAEGISTGHPTMPEYRLEPDEADALIAYLKSLDRG